MSDFTERARFGLMQEAHLRRQEVDEDIKAYQRDRAIAEQETAERFERACRPGAFRDPSRNGKVHLRGADGRLGCNVWGAFLSQAVTDLSLVPAEGLCRRCFPFGVEVTVR